MRDGGAGGEDGDDTMRMITTVAMGMGMVLVVTTMAMLLLRMPARWLQRTHGVLSDNPIKQTAGDQVY